MQTQFPASVIAGLYKDSLVLVEESHAKPAKKQGQVTNKTTNAEALEQEPRKIWFLGENKKNITILVNDPDAAVINDEWLATLTKLLTACRLNLADIAIVNTKENLAFSFIKEHLQPECVLMFDVSTAALALPFSIPHYQVQKYGGCTFMTAPAITLSAGKTAMINTEKRNLWEKLKLIFNV